MEALDIKKTLDRIAEADTYDRVHCSTCEDFDRRGDYELGGCRNLEGSLRCFHGWHWETIRGFDGHEIENAIEMCPTERINRRALVLEKKGREESGHAEKLASQIESSQRIEASARDLVARRAQARKRRRET